MSKKYSKSVKKKIIDKSVKKNYQKINKFVSENYSYDMIVIGLGPAGIALAKMGYEAGLKVLAVENRKIGGECLNYGCLPSKALLKTSHVIDIINNSEKYGLSKLKAIPDKIFQRLKREIDFIRDYKMVEMIENTKVIYGTAKFFDKKTVDINGKKYRAKKIYICTGTIPMIPPILGLNKINYFTNQNIFYLKTIPTSMFILGGGAIGCEMAQAFSRLGCKVTIAHKDPHLMPQGDFEASQLLEETFKKEGITIINGANIKSFETKSNGIQIKINDKQIITETVLVAAGRGFDFSHLNLDAAKIKYSNKGIKVNNNLETNIKNIYAVGDCNNEKLFSHAAMHQSIIALFNSMSPFKFNFRNYPVPWSVFTNPEFAQVGLTQKELDEKHKKYEIIKVLYSNYGRAIVDEAPKGFVKVFANKFGKVYGAVIIGEYASELIQEFTLVIQKKINLFDIMMMQHSFPTISLLNKQISEEWMINRMHSPVMRFFSKTFFGKF